MLGLGSRDTEGGSHPVIPAAHRASLTHTLSTTRLPDLSLPDGVFRELLRNGPRGHSRTSTKILVHHDLPLGRSSPLRTSVSASQSGPSSWATGQPRPSSAASVCSAAICTPEDGQCPGAGVRGTHSGFPHVTASGARRAGAMGAGFRGGAGASERREPESAQGTGCGRSGRQRGSPHAGVDTALLARGSLPGGRGVLWKEAPLHAAPALHVPKQLCCGAPGQAEAGGVTPPSPPRSSKHRKCSGRVSSA